MVQYPNDYIYDLETYGNVFTGVFVNEAQKKVWIFEISDRKDDTKRLRSFLKKLYKDKARMVGFNNIGFDYPILHWWLKVTKVTPVTAKEIFNFAQDIINTQREDKFANTIPEKKHFIQQLDLYKIHHMDNAARATSLKMIEFNARSENIEDLPFEIGRILTDSEIDTLIQYNRHDVMETLKFYKESLGAIKMREDLGENYGMNCMNFNDTKIGKEYFVKMLEKEMKGCCYDYSSGKRKIRQTHRKSIDISEIIFDYVKFERPEFRALLEWFKAQTVTETKGVFTDLEEHDLGELAKYSRLVTKKKKLKHDLSDEDHAKYTAIWKDKKNSSDEDRINARKMLDGKPSQEYIDELTQERPCSWISETELKSGKFSYHWNWRIAEALNVVVDGFEYVYGVGGIHASVEGVTFESNEDFVIIDYDYRSMYPNIFISNRVHPEHLSDKFCDIYEDVYLQRKSYPKGTPENAVMKLALNGTYGATNDRFSPFYDPKAMMTITVNGQLTLSCLAEKLINIDGLQMIQCNTDGLTVYCKRKDEALVGQIVDDWDAVIGLEMEKVTYSKMAIANVNNYLAVYEESGKVKRNGAYQFEGLGWHQNQSSLVIQKAACEYITNGVPIEKTIKNNRDPYDFMLRTKVPRTSRLVTIDEEGLEYPEQNICRYYISDRGRKLVKIMPPLPTKDEERYIGIDKAWLVRTCNDMKEFNWDINYDYYIEEAQKLVDAVNKVEEF